MAIRILEALAGEALAVEELAVDGADDGALDDGALAGGATLGLVEAGGVEIGAVDKPDHHARQQEVLALDNKAWPYAGPFRAQPVLTRFISIHPSAMAPDLYFSMPWRNRSR